MHTTGVRFKTSLYRSGAELAPVDPLQWFDFDFQVVRDSGAGGVVVRPSDTLTFTCYYDTESRLSDVTGGDSTDTEM